MRERVQSERADPCRSLRLVQNIIEPIGIKRPVRCFEIGGWARNNLGLCLSARTSGERFL